MPRRRSWLPKATRTYSTPDPAAADESALETRADALASVKVERLAGQTLPLVMERALEMEKYGYLYSPIDASLFVSSINW